MQKTIQIIILLLTITISSFALTTQYTFEQQNATFLKNAIYVQMIEVLDNLSNKLTENDNLLVFYAGHGWWDDDKNLGYWLPIDAQKSNTAFWIANSRISDYMSSIKSKHTLLIADACFAVVFLKQGVHLPMLNLQ